MSISSRAQVETGTRGLLLRGRRGGRRRLYSKDGDDYLLALEDKDEVRRGASSFTEGVSADVRIDVEFQTRDN